MKSHAIGLAVAAMFWAGTAQAEVVILDSAVYGGHQYHLVGERDSSSGKAGVGVNWSDAQNYAQSLNGHLATIGDQAEDDFLFNLWGAAEFEDFGPVANLWIGLSDALVEGNFLWASGAPSGYTNWAPGEPNNDLAAGGENYAAIIASLSDPDRGQWNDQPNIPESSWYVNYGVVEIVPEPSGIVLSLVGLLGLALVARKQRKSKSPATVGE